MPWTEARHHTVTEAKRFAPNLAVRVADDGQAIGADGLCVAVLTTVQEPEHLEDPVLPPERLTCWDEVVLAANCDGSVRAQIDHHRDVHARRQAQVHYLTIDPQAGVAGLVAADDAPVR